MVNLQYFSSQGGIVLTNNQSCMGFGKKEKKWRERRRGRRRRAVFLFIFTLFFVLRWGVGYVAFQT